MGGAKKALKKTIGGKLGLFGSDQKTPDVVQRDPEAEKIEAENKAQETANAEAAQKKKNRKANSLLSAGGEAGSVLATGKTKLGQ